jgi:hypothetical protein
MAERKSVEQYIAGVTGWQHEVLAELDVLVRKAAPKATHSVKWAQPVYEQNGPMVWMKPFTNTVNIGFWRGAEMDDPKGMLEGEGDRMRHVKIAEGGTIPEQALRRLVKQAVKLNEEKGDPTRRGAKK